MKQPEFDFDPMVLRSLIGGVSVLDIPRLRVQNRAEAVAFMRAYGYDLDLETDQTRLASFHRRAITYIQTQLLKVGEEIPPSLAEGVLLGDLANLILFASSEEPQQLARQKWACAILRVMHVMAHSANDLFTAFSDDIQQQILRPYQERIHTDERGVATLGVRGEPDAVELEKFDVKPFKTSNSSITKLLAKPDAVAFGLLDKMGVRFVTHSLFDCFRVLRYLAENNLISIPHLIPDQSNNTLYPINLFLEVVSEIATGPAISATEIDRRLHDKLAASGERGTYREKLNSFTSRDYRFIKFIVRRLIRARVEGMERPFMFFYPYEVQIMDHETHLKNSAGPSSHDQYKGRQRARARERVFGGNEIPLRLPT